MSVALKKSMVHWGGSVRLTANVRGTDPAAVHPIQEPYRETQQVKITGIG